MANSTVRKTALRQDAKPPEPASSGTGRNGAPDLNTFYDRLEAQLAEIRMMIEARNARAARLIRPADGGAARK